MRKFKKSLAVLMALALSATAFVGCGKDDSSKDSAKDSGKDSSKTDSKAPALAADTGKVLNVYCWNDEFKGRFEKYFPQDKLNGVTVKWVINPNQGGVYQQKLDAALKVQDTAAADEKIDMFLVEADYALKYVNTDVSLDIKSLGLTDADLSNQYQYTKDLVTSKDGKLKAVSWQACPGLFAYRRSIAKDVLGTDEPDKVQEKLSDWTKFDDVAKAMKDKGYFMISNYEAAYRVYSNNTSGKLVNDKNEIVVDKALKAWADQTKTYADKKYVQGTALWSTDFTKGMGDGSKVFGYFWSTWGINFSLHDASMKTATKDGGKEEVGNGTFGDWAVCYGPQSYFWGGSWLCACKGSDNLNLVASIFKTMTCDATVMEKNTRETLDMTNNKAAMNNIANDASYKAAIIGGQNHIALFTKAAEKINMKNTTPYDQPITEEYQSAMTDYFTGKVTYDKALDTFYTKAITRAPSLKRPA